MATTVHETVVIYCSVCHCSERIENGWDDKVQAAIGRAGEILASGFGIKRGASTPQDHCTCHSGIGMLPRLGIKIE